MKLDGVNEEMIAVIHLRNTPHGWEKNPKYVYIGRSGRGLSSKLGNPIRRTEPCPVCGALHSIPGSTLPCYEVWLRKKIEESDQFKSWVKDLEGKVLVCFCKPSPCHGDILAKVSKELNKMQVTQEMLIESGIPERFWDEIIKNQGRLCPDCGKEIPWQCFKLSQCESCSRDEYNMRDCEEK